MEILNSLDYLLLFFLNIHLIHGTNETQTFSGSQRESDTQAVTSKVWKNETSNALVEAVNRCGKFGQSSRRSRCRRAKAAELRGTKAKFDLAPAAALERSLQSRADEIKSNELGARTCVQTPFG